jgi:NAD(P)-dependent dehydrogenase (short-subunit alcohol dehydrogenase family)
MELSGKVAVITGGASGIGLATGRQLAARGVNLVLVDIEAAALARAAASFPKDCPVRIETRVCDVSDHDAMWGPIHGVEAFLPHLQASGEGAHLLFTASFAGLVPNVGLGPYCVAKYGVVALAEVLHKELRNEGIGVSVLCPMRVGTNIGESERNRHARYGGAAASPVVADQSEANEDLAGRVLDVDDVAAR